MATDLILEVGTEEIPGGLPAAGAGGSWQRWPGTGLEDELVWPVGAVRALGTPRRLVLRRRRGVAAGGRRRGEGRPVPCRPRSTPTATPPGRRGVRARQRRRGDRTCCGSRRPEGSTSAPRRRNWRADRPPKCSPGWRPAWIARLPFRKSMRWGAGGARSPARCTGSSPPRRRGGALRLRGRRPAAALEPRPPVPRPEPFEVRTRRTTSARSATPASSWTRRSAGQHRPPGEGGRALGGRTSWCPTTTCWRR